MSPKWVGIYSSHAIGHGSMRVHGAPRRRTRAPEHRLEKRRGEIDPDSWTTPSLRRMSASSRCQWTILAFLCLPVDTPNVKDHASTSARIQESYSGLRVFSGEPPLSSPPVTDLAVLSVFSVYAPFVNKKRDDNGRGRFAVAVQGADSATVLC